MHNKPKVCPHCGGFTIQPFHACDRRLVTRPIHKSDLTGKLDQ